MDDALDKPLKKQVETLLSDCPDYSGHLDELKKIRSNLSEESTRQVPVPKAEFMWTKLQSTSELSFNQFPSRGKLMQTGWALACTLLLTASILFFAREKSSSPISQSVQSSSVFDINGLIETFHESEKRQQFYTAQGATPITQGQCCISDCAGCCDTRMLTALQEHCSALKNRLLKSADGSCIIIECSLQGNMITIIRQTENAVSTLENVNTQKQVITGVVYERSLKNDVQITRWQSDSGKVTVLGDLSDTELKILIGASQ